MSERSFDAIVLGAGPGGYVCAIRLAQLGRKVAVVEEQWLGGVCLNVGCIPSKAMISAGALVKRLGDASKMGIEVGEVRVDMEKLQAWKGSVVDRLTSGVGTLFKGNKIEVVSGRGRLVAPDRIEVTGEAGTETITAPSIVLATGSRPIEIPGFAFDEEKVLSSTGALALAEVPGRVCVIGGGYIGLEIGMMLRHLGSEVTVVEMTDTLLPGTEPQLVKVVARSAKKQKIKVHTKSKALGWEEKDGSLVVRVETPKGELEVPCDKILLTVGRRPNTEGIGLEDVGVKLDDHGFVETDASLRTSVPGVYAIGDLAGQPMLAHKASKEGLIAAEAVCGRPSVRDWRCVPAVIFTDPEVASVGLTEAEAVERGHEVAIGKFPFAANGRALSLMETEGFTMVVADKKTDEVLGVHMVGPEVTELIGEATLAIEMGATAEDIALTIHAHPTLPETLMEAAEAVHGMAVHALSK
jgi:dihydrolipoamide dehydrogenase